MKFLCYLKFLLFLTCNEVMGDSLSGVYRTEDSIWICFSYPVESSEPIPVLKGPKVLNVNEIVMAEGCRDYGQKTGLENSSRVVWARFSLASPTVRRWNLQKSKYVQFALSKTQKLSAKLEWKKSSLIDITNTELLRLQGKGKTKGAGKGDGVSSIR